MEVLESNQIKKECILKREEDSLLSAIIFMLGCERESGQVQEMLHFP